MKILNCAHCKCPPRQEAGKDSFKLVCDCPRGGSVGGEKTLVIKTWNQFQRQDRKKIREDNVVWNPDETRFAAAVRQELNDARKGHGPMHSAHEAYAVILEELNEFWDEVKKKREQRSKSRMYAELVQVSAMCQRAAEDLKLEASCPTT